MVYEILATTPFGKEKKGEVGIERMVEEGAYSAGFPLHDVSVALKKTCHATLYVQCTFLLFVFSACGEMRTSSKLELPVLTAYFPVLA